MFELSIVVKATVVLALALIAARLARSARASVRHQLLAAAFGALAILPAAAVLMPRVELEIPIESSGSATPFIVDDIRGPMPQASVIIYDSSQEGRPWTPAPASTWLRVGWAGGALLFLVGGDSARNQNRIARLFQQVVR